MSTYPAYTYAVSSVKTINLNPRCCKTSQPFLNNTHGNDLHARQCISHMKCSVICIFSHSNQFFGVVPSTTVPASSLPVEAIATTAIASYIPKQQNAVKMQCRLQQLSIIVQQLMESNYRSHYSSTIISLKS